MKEITKEDLRQILREIKTWAICALRQYQLDDMIVSCQETIRALEEEKRAALTRLFLKLNELGIEPMPKKKQKNNSWRAYK